MKYRPLQHSPFGVQLDCEPKTVYSDSEQHYLRTLLDEHGLILVRGQVFSDAEHAALVNAFGRVEQDQNGRDFIMRVSNKYEDSSAPQGELPFHFDYSYDPKPVSVIGLYGSEIVGEVTPTLFVPSVFSVGELPVTLHNAINGRETVQACFPEQFSSEFMREQAAPELVRGQQGWSAEHWWMRKPALQKLADKRECLFVCELYTHSIVGLPEEESRALLQALFKWLYREDRQYSHQWRRDDLIIWDNLRVQHARPVPNDNSRTLRRFHTAIDDLTEDYLKVGRANKYL